MAAAATPAGHLTNGVAASRSLRNVTFTQSTGHFTTLLSRPTPATDIPQALPARNIPFPLPSRPCLYLCAWCAPAADFPSLALEDEAREDDYDTRRRAALHAAYQSQAPVVFSHDVDDPRLRWKGDVSAPPSPVAACMPVACSVQLLGVLCRGCRAYGSC